MFRVKWYKKRWIGILLALCMALGALPFFPITSKAAGNPYGRTQTMTYNGVKRTVVRCTWYAWEQVKANHNIELPGWKDAGTWLTYAQNAGYSTGTEPRVGALAVWKNTRNSWGHVAYVTAVNDGSITVNEGGSVDKRASAEGVFIGHNVPDTRYGATEDEHYWPDGYIYFTAAPQPEEPVGSTMPDNPGYRPISDGDYFIVSALGGTPYNPASNCLTFEGVPVENKSGAYAKLRPVYNQEGHLFTVTWLKNGFYEIKLKASPNLRLNVVGANKERGANVMAYGAGNSTPDINEQWYINETGDGDGYTIQSKCSGFYLNVAGSSTADGTDILMWNNDGNGFNKNERWYFIPWGGGSTAKPKTPDGEYQIVSDCNNSKALYADGNSLKIGARSNDANQIFQVGWRGNGEYEIIHKRTGLSLDVPGGYNKRFTSISLIAPNQGCNQRWLLRWSSNGTFYVATKSSGLVLDYDVTSSSASGSTYLYCEQNGAGEKWRFIPWGESIGQTIPDGEYQIVSQAGGDKVLSVDESQTGAGNGMNVKLNSRLGDERYTFDVKYLGNGYYSIVNRNLGLALGAADNWSNGANAQLREANAEDGQKWMIRDCGDGSYDIISKSSGLYLSADNIDPPDGTDVFMSDSRLGTTDWKDCQKWQFIPYVRVDQVSLSQSSLTLAEGAQETLQATITPSDANDKTLSWASSDAAIAEVDENGTVTAKAAGTATITVTSANGKTASCEVTVEHTYGDEWKTDADSHWKECACRAKSEESAHAFVWKIDREPTEEAEGIKHEECSVCGFIRNENTAIDKLPPSHEHDFGSAWKSDEQNHWKECSCGKISAQSPHSFLWITDVEPTQEAEGLKHEECMTCGLKRNEGTVIGKLPPSHRHDYGTEWKSDGQNHWKECSCGDILAQSPHSFIWVTDTEPTQETEGLKHEECMTCGVKRNEDTVIGKLPPSHRHDYGTEWKSDEQNHWKECACGDKVAKSPHSFAWVIDQKATQEADGLKHEECTACDMRRSEGTVIEKLPSNHEHSYDTAWKTDAQSHWKECACGERSEESPHSFAWVTDREPTQETVGLQHEECDLCGLKRSEGTVIEKLPSDHEHSFGTVWIADAQSHWKECACGERSEESLHSFAWVTDREPTQETVGLQHEECDLCGLKRNEGTVIEKLPTPTPDPTPEPTPSPTPEPTPDPDQPVADAPFIKGDQGKMGWDVILDILDKTEERAVVTVDMNGTSLVPGTVLDDMKARNVTVVFDMGGGIAWSVDGQGVTAGKADAIDFSIKVGTDSIPADIVNSVANGRYHIQISLAHEGAFGCTPVLSVNLGKENAGLTAGLYYYNQASGKLEPVSEAGIAEDGTANLAFQHASDYLIIVKSADDTADTPPQTPADPAPTPTPPGGADINPPQTPPGITDIAQPQAPTDSADSSSPAPEAAQGTDSSAPEASVLLSPATGEDTQSSWFHTAIGALAFILSAGIAVVRRKKALEHKH